MFAERYSEGLPGHLPAYSRPMPFAYQSTGEETRFTKGLQRLNMGTLPVF